MQNIIRVARVANPRKSSARRRRSNPLRAITLGASNPRRARKKMARRKTTRRRRATAARPVRRRRRNTALGSVRRRARRNPARRRRNATRITIRRTRRRNGASRRRNPSLFGARVSAAQMTEAVLGGLVGVTAAKMIPGALPGQLTGTPTMRVLSSVASAFLAGWAAGKVSPRFGDAVLFGGLMQAGSLALNTFVPSIGTQIGLSGIRGGLGELMAGAYPVPQNPLNPAQANYPAYGRPMVAAGGTYGAGAPVTMNGLSRAFGTAF